jgi:plastocyanin
MNTKKACLVVLAVTALMAASGACGGSSNPTAPSNPPPPAGGGGGGGGTGSGNVFTLTSAGVSPTELTVSPGTRVQFVNNDSRNHEMNSDPHPTHGDCPELDAVGFLTPGQSRESGTFTTARTCGFHDHNLFPQPQWQGRVVVR